MSKSQKLIEKMKKNPFLSMIIIEIILLFFPGYTVTTIPEEQHYPTLLIKAAFENMSILTYIFQICIVISPFAMLVLYFLNIEALNNRKLKIYKFFMSMGLAGSILYIWMAKRLLKVMEERANLGDVYYASQELKLGIAPWLMIIMFIIQLLYIWVYTYDKNKETANDNQNNTGDDTN